MTYKTEYRLALVRNVVLLIVLTPLLLPIILIGKAFEFTRNGVAWFSEKVLKKPFGLGWLNHSLAKRQRLCPHLNGLKLTKYEQNEPFLWAKCERNANETLADMALRVFVEGLKTLNLCQNVYVGKKKARVSLDEAPGIHMQTDFIDEIYALESECFRTSVVLKALAKSLQGFGFDTKELCEYSVSASKYDLAEYGKYSFEEIQLMKEHLQGVREMLMFIRKTAWLDGLAQRHNAFDKLSKEEQESVTALFNEAKQIHKLITSDFVDFNIEWKATQTLIDEAKDFAPKDEAQNAIKAEFSSNADENKPNDKA